MYFSSSSSFFFPSLCLSLIFFLYTFKFNKDQEMEHDNILSHSSMSIQKLSKRQQSWEKVSKGLKECQLPKKIKVQTNIFCQRQEEMGLGINQKDYRRSQTDIKWNQREAEFHSGLIIGNQVMIVYSWLTLACQKVCSVY